MADESGHGILLELAALDLPLRDGWYSGGVGGEKGSFKAEPGELLVTLSPLVLHALGSVLSPQNPSEPKPSEPQNVTNLMPLI